MRPKETAAANREPSQVLVFDTTLRDGEQSPGCTMNPQEKLRIAHALAEAGVDIIEAGFPISSEGDFESTRLVAQEIQGPTIASLARCATPDITRAWEAVCDAARPRIHTFLATSAIHREHKLRMAKKEIVRRAVEGVSRAKALCEDVEFSPEDAARTEPEFLAEVVEAVISAGATTVNIPDTVGYAVPEQYGACFEFLRKNVRGVDGVVLGAHCHDDLGLAVANSLAAIRAGARQVECTVNGIGERAGNAALEEIVMALHTRSEFFACTTRMNTRRLIPLSRLVSSITGSAVQANKSIVGENAFAHEAGIHQHGMIQNRQTYEIMKPEDVGLERTHLVLGKHSGRHAFCHRLEHLGLRVGPEDVDRLFIAFKALADKKKRVYDSDVEAIVLNDGRTNQAEWSIRALQITTGTNSIPTASVELEHVDGRRVAEACVGDGPVDAAFKALRLATGASPVVRGYRVRSVTDGDDAQGEVVIDAELDDRRLHGRAVGTDIVEASARAFLDIVNRMKRVPTAVAECPVRGTECP